MQNEHSENGTLVKPDEAALIVDTDGDVRICMQEYGEDEEVPYHVAVIMAVWIKMRDDEQWALDLAQEVFSED